MGLAKGMTTRSLGRLSSFTRRTAPGCANALRQLAEQEFGDDVA